MDPPNQPTARRLTAQDPLGACFIRTVQILFVCCALTLMGFGLCFVLLHDVRVAQFRSVDAVVVSKGEVVIPRRRGGVDDMGPTYVPIIQYRYQVDGREYASGEVLSNRGSFQYREEAQEIVDRFAVGQVVQAHYNPQDHSDAYLIRWTDCVGYLFIMVGTLFLVFQYIFFRSRKTRNVHRVATTITLVWYGAAILVWAHYFLMVGWGYSRLGLAFACTSVAIGLIPAAVAIRSRPIRLRLTHDIDSQHS